jgi:hypothetical protein
MLSGCFFVLLKGLVGSLKQLFSRRELLSGIAPLVYTGLLFPLTKE